MIFSTVAGSLLFLGLLSQVPDQADRWTAIRSDEGDFSARMPTKPSLEQAASADSSRKG